MNSNDFGSLFTPLHIGLFLLAVAVIITFVKIIARGFNALTRYSCGWKALTQRFPATDVHKFGESCKKRNGIFGNNECNGFFLIELAHEGLLITADFDRTPILIPWSAIRAIDEMNVFGFTMMVNLTINYERRLIFDLSKDALKAIQENVPVERFHKTNFLELVKKNLLNKPQN